jgi:DNA-directed RNA polymerase specialized sigma54-like protein
MLADINFFVDMINQRIESGLLISEIIKVNSGSEDSSSFVNYLIEKIVNEGYFKSSLFKLLIKLANIDQSCEEGEIPRSMNENSNQ